MRTTPRAAVGPHDPERTFVDTAIRHVGRNAQMNGRTLISPVITYSTKEMRGHVFGTGISAGSRQATSAPS
jgi:hypothetical protein